MHSSLIARFGSGPVMIDCGLDWLGKVGQIRPGAIVITHAHPDHAWGLKEGAPCPVYASAETWDVLASYPVEKIIVPPRRQISICGIAFEAFPVDHSTRAPAAGYRVTGGRASFFYAPDLVYIHDRAAALDEINLYIGDGATVARSFVRKRGGALIGHAPVRTQLTWCHKEGVPRAIFTHCGSQIVTGDEDARLSDVKAMARERGVAAEVAFDGMEVDLP